MPGSHICSERGWDAELMTMMNRSSHIPIKTNVDATTEPGIVRVFLGPSIASGMTKHAITIPQK